MAKRRSKADNIVRGGLLTALAAAGAFTLVKCSPDHNPSERAPATVTASPEGPAPLRTTGPVRCLGITVTRASQGGPWTATAQVEGAIPPGTTVDYQPGYYDTAHDPAVTGQQPGHPVSLHAGRLVSVQAVVHVLTRQGAQTTGCSPWHP